MTVLGQLVLINIKGRGMTDKICENIVIAIQVLTEARKLRHMLNGKPDAMGYIMDLGLVGDDSNLLWAAGFIASKVGCDKEYAEKLIGVIS